MVTEAEPTNLQGEFATVRSFEVHWGHTNTAAVQENEIDNEHVTIMMEDKGKPMTNVV